MRGGAGGGGLLGEAREHPPLDPQVERQHVAVQHARFALQPHQPGDRGLGIDFGQENVDA